MSTGSTGQPCIRHAETPRYAPRRPKSVVIATPRYSAVTTTLVTPLSLSTGAKHSAAPPRPTTSVDTHGEPNRWLTVPNARLAAVGQARSRAEAYSTREFWMTITITALMMASAMHKLTNVPTPVL